MAPSTVWTVWCPQQPSSHRMRCNLDHPSLRSWWSIVIFAVPHLVFPGVSIRFSPSFRYVESRALIPTGRTMKRYGHEEQSKTRGAIENCLNYPFAHAHRRAGALRCVVPRYRPSSSRYCSILYNMYKFDLLAQYVQHVQHVQYGRNILFNIVHEYLAYCTICN